MEKKENEDLEILDMEVEIREFIREPNPHRTDAKRTLQKKRRKRNGTYDTGIWMLGMCINVIVIILCSIFLVKISVSTVLIVAALEILLAVCLYNAPFWLHVLVFLLHVILGIVFSMTVFLLLGVEIYLVGIVVMHQKQKKSHSY